MTDDLRTRIQSFTNKLTEAAPHYDNLAQRAVVRLVIEELTEILAVEETDPSRDVLADFWRSKANRAEAKLRSVEQLIEPSPNRCGFELVEPGSLHGAKFTVWVSPMATAAAYPPEGICNRDNWVSRDLLIGAADIRAALRGDGS